MNGLSFSATTEKRKGILLDPRTKLILLLTITTLMFSTSNEGIMNIVKPCLSLVPFALILSERRFKTAGKYLVLYAVCFILERIALTSLSGLLSFIVLAAKLAQESSTMKYMGIYVPTIQRLNTAYPIRLFLALL